METALQNAPFLRREKKTVHIMGDVLIALMPVSVMAVVMFGLRSLLLMVISVATCVFLEFITQRIMKRPSTVYDLSACVTGLLIGLSFPVVTPIWLIVFADFVAIVFIKQLPGGLGRNVFNPAVFARVLSKVLFTPFFTNWVSPLPDMTSTATPLSMIGNGMESVPAGAPSLYQVFMGNIGGNMGETVKWAIILGFLYLSVRKVINPLIPLATLVGLFLTTLLFGGTDPYFALYHVLTGTAMFASVFMVTDYTSGPLHTTGRIYYALIIGILTGILRYVFNLPGGIGIAILIMNMFSPFMDKITEPRAYGEKLFADNVYQRR